MRVENIIIWIVESRRMRWVRHVAHMGEEVNSHRVCWGNLKERDHLKYIDIDRRIILTPCRPDGLLIKYPSSRTY